jgi:type I restriction enzyme R subunit
LSDELNITQIPAIQLLERLGWQRIKDIRQTRKRVILEDILTAKLNEINLYYHNGIKKRFSKANVQNAINSLRTSLDSGLVAANKEIYELLTGSRAFKVEGNKSQTFRYFDFDNINNNAFNMIEEFVVEGKDENIRIDIVLFINGIPLVTLECKDPSIEVEEAVSQTIRNQTEQYAPELFKYIQLTIASNKNEVKYGTCGTPKKFYSVWKEEELEWHQEQLERCIIARMPTKQDMDIISLLSKERLFDIFQNYIVFDKNIKKIARHQQFFAVKDIITRVATRNQEGKRKGGVIWHTQGSGKSLTMVMLTKALVESPKIPSAKIVVVTDRITLDKQITQTFNNTDFNPHQAGTAKDLVEAIKNNKEIITTTVHKFEGAYRANLVDESKDIFILVDESHRTEYGLLNQYMNKVFPNAAYIGFTGTPLMKEDKNTMEKFGGLIHTYTIQDAVADNVIVPLIYEGKTVEQSINAIGIDNKLNQITNKLNERQTRDLKQKWASYNKMASSDSRIDFIAFDIHHHFYNQFRRNSPEFKAMLATSSKVEAITYLNKLEQIGDLEVAVMISPPDTREGYTTIDEKSSSLVLNFWERMMKRYNRSPEQYERDIKDEFVNGSLDIVIVVDKLLTGFDAPRAVVLYIDKPLKEHSLLQAIARVNRIYEGKDYGFIVDYRGLIQQLDEAMGMYSGAGLENYDPEDIRGALIDVKKVADEVQTHYSNLEDFFITISNKEDLEEYERYLEPDHLRQEFYERLSLFSRNLKVVLGSVEATEHLGLAKVNKYREKFKFYQNLRGAVKRRYSDEVDFKEYEDQMKNMLDTYVNAQDIISVIAPVNVMEVDAFEKELSQIASKEAKADTIRTRISTSIQDIKTSDPIRYKKFSEMLREAYEEYKRRRQEEAEQMAIRKQRKAEEVYYDKMNNIKTEYQKGREKKEYPETLQENTNAQVFYDILKDISSSTVKEANSEVEVFNQAAALYADRVLREKIKPDWHKTEDNVNDIKIEIVRYVRDYTKNSAMNIEFSEIKRIANEIISTAKVRYRFE